MAAAAHKHPNYVLIWFYLAVLTGAELVVALLKVLPRNWLVTALIFLAIWKAMLVALYFMHLKFEPRRLVVTIIAPLPLAVILVLAVLREYAK